MKRFANDLPWSIEMQNMYDELDVELGDYDRFKTGLTTVYSQAVVVLHENSEVRKMEDIYRCHVVYGDEDSNYVQLYILKKDQQAEGEKKGLLAQRFRQWLSLPAFGHPGLSSEPEILAADMLAVLIFHRNVFIFDDSNKKKDHFNTAQRMKKQFSRYHTNEKHCRQHSVHHWISEPIERNQWLGCA